MRITEKAKPQTPSTSPEASMGSRTGKPMDSSVMAEVSIPAASTNAGHWAKAPSGGGAPSFLPSSDFGSVVTPSDLRPTTAKVGRS
ncbi:hypothetical protein D3C87_2042280 [compost metagenome]